MTAGKTYTYSLLIIFLFLILVGCSNSDHPLTPTDIPSSREISQGNGAHISWGVWLFTADPVGKTLDVTMLREGNFHLNALFFLEPPPPVTLKIETLEFNGNIIDTDISLLHPFTDLDEFTGFDVCGVFITKGSTTGFSDSSLRMAGDGDTRLLNPDGLIRWWNPVEFPHNAGMNSYIDGILGAPDSSANFNCTINAYKYFADNLPGSNSPLSALTGWDRGYFSAGSKNIRHYTIELGADGMTFNYAVDASWDFPVGSPPYDVPQSFGLEANRPEAWRTDITEIGNTLWNDGVDNGGSLNFSFDLYDWYNAGLNTLYVESPGNFPPIGPIIATGGGTGYSTYEVDIIDATPQNSGNIDVLIISESEATGYGGILPGEPQAAYFLFRPTVGTYEPIICDLQVITPMPYDDWEGFIEFDASGSSDPDGGQLDFSWDFDDDGVFGDLYDAGTDANPLKYYSEDFFGQVCVKVSNATQEVTCCVDVNITAHLSKDIDISFYTTGVADICMDHTTGDVLAYYPQGIRVRRYFRSTFFTTFHEYDDNVKSGYQHMDMSPNGYYAIGWCSGGGGVSSINLYHYGPTGAFVSAHSSMYWGGDGLYQLDVVGMGASGSYPNWHVAVNNWSMSPTSGNINGWAWEPDAYNTGTTFNAGFSGSVTGNDKIQARWIKASESEDGTNVWHLQGSPNFYVNRWTITSSFANGYWGTGSATDSDNGMNDPKDVTRDDNDNYYVLDQLSDNSYTIKGFNWNGSSTTTLPSFGDSDDWAYTPTRIEGSNYDGVIVVLQTGGSGAYLSVFTEDETSG